MNKLTDQTYLLSQQYGDAAKLNVRIEVHRRFNHLIRGVALRVDPATLPALRALPGVRGVYPDVRLTAALADSVPLVGAPQVWALTDGTGQPVTGQTDDQTRSQDCRDGPRSPNATRGLARTRRPSSLPRQRGVEPFP